MIALLALAFNLRTAITAVPPLLDQIDADLQFTPVLIGVLGALPTVAFALAGLVGARLLRKLTAERIAVGVLALTGIGQLIRPWAGSAPGFLALSALSLLAMGVGNVILPALVRAWFPDRIGSTTSAYMTCITIGTALPALLAVPLAGLVPGMGWKLGLVVWSATALVVVPAWMVIARRPRALPAAADSPAVRLPMYRSPIAWGVALLFGMCSLNIYSMITWLPILLVDAGFSPELAGTALAVYAGGDPAIAPPAAHRRPAPTTASARPGVRRGLCDRLCRPALRAHPAADALGLDRRARWWRLPARDDHDRDALGFSRERRGPLRVRPGRGYALAGAGPFVVGLLHDGTSGWAAPFAFLGATLLIMLAAGRLLAPARTIEADLALRSTDTLER